MGIRPVLCSVCFKPIDVKMYKVDSVGRAVHEECYVTLLRYQPNPERKGLISRVFALLRRAVSANRTGRP